MKSRFRPDRDQYSPFRQTRTWIFGGEQQLGVRIENSDEERLSLDTGGGGIKKATLFYAGTSLS